MKERDHIGRWKMPRAYWIKDFGADVSYFHFNRWLRVIERARAAITDDVVGFLLFALGRPPRMTGLLFGDVINGLPDGLPIHTPPLESRYRRQGYEIVIAEDGGSYVIAHWLYENGELDRFDRVN